jgi:two-component sensor histidine kinase
LTAPLWRYVGITTAAALILLAIGLSFAIRMATRIAHAEALHGLLVEELNHRVKNTLAMTQSLATQSFKPGADMKEAIGKFEARLTAFGRAHNVLNQQKWESADIRDIVEDLLEPFGADAGRVRATGPAIRLSPSRALMMSMVLHELATNAVKYGALSNAVGKVAIEWTTDEAGALRLTWRESGGPTVRTPSQRGFGSRLLEQSFGRNSDRAEIEFNETGIVCTIVCADPS